MEEFLVTKLYLRYKTLEKGVAKLIVSYLTFNIATEISVHIPSSIGYRGMLGDPSTLHTCQCGEQILYENFDEHEELDCPLHPRFCAQCYLVYESKEELLIHKKETCAFSLHTCKFHKKGSWPLKNLWNHYICCKEATYCYMCEICYDKENKGLHEYYHF